MLFLPGTLLPGSTSDLAHTFARPRVLSIYPTICSPADY